MRKTVSSEEQKPLLHHSRRKELTTHAVGANLGEVRIIGGQWKRTKLPVADVSGLRPTPARVRETLFNWLGQDLSGWRCLDAFAGSGALGFEAASRGAMHVVMVEKNRRLAGHLRQVQVKLGAQQIHIVCDDALSVLKCCERESMDAVFLDPPFTAGLFEVALVAALPVIVPQGVIYLEADRAVEAPPGLSCYRQARAAAVYYYLFVSNHQHEA